MAEVPKAPGPESQEVERKKLIDLTRATVVLLSDFPPISVDAIFFHARSYFDAGKQDIFKVAADMIREERARYIVLADSEGERVGETTPRMAYPGKSLWTDRLVRLGVKQEQIIYSSHLEGEKGFHTRTESDAFLETARQRGFKSAVLLTQPHQVVRAMLGTVRVINERGLSINVWCMFPQLTDWNKRVMGSQGNELKPRIEHIEDEIKRIFTYQKEGALATFDELFEYLKKRDG